MNLTIKRARKQTLPRLSPAKTSQVSAEPVPQRPEGPQESCDISFAQKATNTGAWTIAGTALGAASTLLVAGAISGPAALGAFVFAPVLAGVGAIVGGVTGWKMNKPSEGACEASTGKKLANSGAWGVAGATLGVAATFAIATTIAGPSALGAFMLTPFLAGGGAIAAGVAGWKMAA